MAGKILIIDDEPDIAQQARDLLRQAGYEVEYVTSAEAGLERIQKEAPDLVISDVVMPGMGGFGFFKEIKANEATKDIPVIIMTARGKMKDTFMVMGADEVLAKPYEDADLLTLVRKYLPGDSDGEGAEAGPADTVQAEEPTPETQDVQAPETTAEVQETVPEEKKETPAAQDDPFSSIPAGQAVLFSGVQSTALARISDLLNSKKVPSYFQRDVLEIADVAVKLSPKCVLLDVITEGLPAPEVVKRIRKRAELKALPIVLFSHLDKEKLTAAQKNQRQVEIQGAKAKAIEAGANAYLGDFDEGTFLSAIDQYIK